MTRLQQGSWNAFPPWVQGRLRRLNRRNGAMREELEKYVVERGDDHKIFVLFEDEVPVAWCLAVWKRTCYYLMLWVRNDRRRQGYGRQLYRRSIRWVDSMGAHSAVFPGGDNISFFKAMRRNKQ